MLYGYLGHGLDAQLSFQRYAIQLLARGWAAAYANSPGLDNLVQLENLRQDVFCGA
jgi:hypothetical protein